MGIAGSPDIFQAEMMKLMESLEYVRAYIGDLLCISRESFDDHLDKLEEVLRQLCNAGLKVNANKSTFCALEIGGPAGEFPANIFEPGKISEKVSRANNNKKQAETSGPRTDRGERFRP
jgi:hypothetical protein